MKTDRPQLVVAAALALLMLVQVVFQATDIAQRGTLLNAGQEAVQDPLTEPTEEDLDDCPVEPHFGGPPVCLVGLTYSYPATRSLAASSPRSKNQD